MTAVTSFSVHNSCHSFIISLILSVKLTWFCYGSVLCTQRLQRSANIWWRHYTHSDVIRFWRLESNLRCVSMLGISFDGRWHAMSFDGSLSSGLSSMSLYSVSCRGRCTPDWVSTEWRWSRLDDCPRVHFTTLHNPHHRRRRLHNSRIGCERFRREHGGHWSRRAGR